MFHEVLRGHSPNPSLLQVVTRRSSSPETLPQPLQASLQRGHFTHWFLACTDRKCPRCTTMTMLTCLSTYSNGPHGGKRYHQPIVPYPTRTPTSLGRGYETRTSAVYPHSDQLFDHYRGVRDRHYTAMLDHGHYRPFI